VSDNAATMSLLEHLEELRRRLIIIIAALVVGVVIGFVFSDLVIRILEAPLPAGYEILYARTVTEGFEVRLKVGIFLGLAISMPVILYEAWRFIGPGLTIGERRVVVPLLGAALLLFALGLEVGYIIVPYALNFLLALLPGGVQPLLSVGDYVSFVSTLMIAFGVVMEFPIVLVALARIGILNYRRLAAQRRFIILGIVIFAVVVTPGGDPISPSLLSAVMYVLFEGSLLVIRLMRR
jgi:sec-independent protein translocase protein TatC